MTIPHDDQIGLPGMDRDELRRRTKALRAQVGQMMDDLEVGTQRLQEQLETAAAIVGTGEAAGGEVQADVDVQGNVLDLRLGDRAVRALGAERLREALLEALRAARADAARQAGATVTAEQLATARDPIGSMLDSMPGIVETLPPDLVARLRAARPQTGGR